MNSFFKSTQCKNWIKTKEEIQKIQQKKVERILKRIKEVNLLIKEENEKLSHSNDPNSIKKDQNFQRYIKPKELESLNDQEKILIIEYSNKLIKILNSQKKSSSFKCTTINYFRRFFLKKSILDYDPNFLMAAAFYLGSKVTQVNLSILEIEKIFVILKNSEKKLFEYEFYLTTILEYEFFVYNPYQALLGFIYILEQKEFFLSQNKENYVEPNEFKQECISIIDQMHLTDNIFLYTYSEIALASIFIKCKEKNLNTINIAEKLEIDKIINVKEFLEGPVVEMKKNLALIPRYENKEDEFKKSNEIYKLILKFHKAFPQYQKKLESERITLRTKMKDFTNDFDILLKKFNLEPKQK